MKNFFYIFLCLVLYTSDCLCKGYMALKHDLGYEAEHQRPENYMGAATALSDKRNFIQNYGLTTNPSGSYNDIQNAHSSEAFNDDFFDATNEYDDDWDENFDDERYDEPQIESHDIKEQTVYVVDHPYTMQY